MEAKCCDFSTSCWPALSSLQSQIYARPRRELKAKLVVLQASVRCIGRGGKLLEIGKYDILKGSNLSMRPMLDNIAFEGIDVDRVMNDPDHAHEVSSCFTPLFASPWSVARSTLTAIIKVPYATLLIMASFWRPLCPSVHTFRTLLAASKLMLPALAPGLRNAKYNTCLMPVRPHFGLLMVTQAAGHAPCHSGCVAAVHSPG